MSYKSIDGIKVPNPPEGIEYRNLGTMEPNICSTLAKWLKHMRASWSKNGANNIANILTEKQNGTIMDTINHVYNDIVCDETYKELEKIIVTAGRNVIRSILRNKKLTDLHY